jgi:DNA transformation protein and related proteins
MSVSEGYREYVQDQLEQVVPVTLRRMFGAVGIYSQRFFFALMDNDTLFFKVDESNRADYEARGMGAFRPFGDDRMIMQYYEVPAEILEDKEQLGFWVRKAVSAAMRKSAEKQSRRRKAAGGTGSGRKLSAGKTPAERKPRPRIPGPSSRAGPSDTGPSRWGRGRRGKGTGRRG